MSQKDFVISKLNRDGFITRNYCLSLFERKERPSITRLGAIINALNNEGWNIEGKNEKGDFIYTVVKTPVNKVIYKLADGREIIKYA